ncbi:MAG: TerB family tellurite resistance protein [Nevskia sp.]
MLNRLRALLGNPSRETRPPSEALATALLLLELARSDFEVAEVEQQRIRQLLAQRYGLDVPGLDALLDEARRSSEASVSLHDYVQTLNASLDAEGKRQLMAMLWQVAYADGRIDKYEEHLLRRLADLLYLPMPDYLQVKLEAAASGAGTQG